MEFCTSEITIAQTNADCQVIVDATVQSGEFQEIRICFWLVNNTYTGVMTR